MPKIEYVYYENGVKITRYAPAKAKGSRLISSWAGARTIQRAYDDSVRDTGRYCSNAIAWNRKGPDL